MNTFSYGQKYNSSNIVGEDVVVLLIGFNRPEKIARRITELSKMNVIKLMISIDGGTDSHNPEMETVIRDAKKSFSAATSVVIHHHKKNMGLAKHVTSAIGEAFKLADYVIVVEDDLVLAPNFYSNMISGFEIQSSSNLHGTVGGFSPYIKKRTINRNNTWRRTIYFSCWGWGCSKEIWNNYKLDLREVDIVDTLGKSLIFKKLSKWQQYLWIKRFQKIQSNPFHTWDIQFQYLCFVNHYVNLLPISRFVDNEGFSDPRGAHTKGKKPQWFKYGGVDNRKIEGMTSPWVSELFRKMIDANTIAGDTKIVKWKNTFDNHRK